MELANDKAYIFGDWSALRPSIKDIRRDRERKKAELLAIRKVYAGLLARGEAAAAEAAAVEAPLRTIGPDAERDLCAAAASVAAVSQPAIAKRNGDATPLAALDECLTPLNARTVLAPGLSSRRASRLGCRSGVQSFASGPGMDEPTAAAALTAQGLKLGQPAVADLSSEFLRQHISLPSQQQQQQATSFPKRPIHQPPSRQQQPQQAQQQRQGRQWRSQPLLMKQMQLGTRRQQARSGGSGSDGGLGAPALAGSGALTAAVHGPTRLGTSSFQGHAALLLSSGGSDSFAAELPAPRAALAQQQEQQQLRQHLDGAAKCSQPQLAGRGDSTKPLHYEDMLQSPASQSHEQQQQKGQQQAGGEHMQLDEPTLPPPSGPAPVPFGSFTERVECGTCPLAQPFLPQGGSLRSAGRDAGQHRDTWAGSSLSLGPDAAGRKRQLHDNVGTSPGPYLQQHAEGGSVEAFMPLQRPPEVCQQPQQLHLQQGEEVVPDSPDFPPESSPPWQISPLPPSVAAEIAVAGAFTPSFPAFSLPGGSAPPLTDLLERPGGPAGQGRFGWDSVPPTPAGLLDYTETADEALPAGVPDRQSLEVEEEEEEQQQQQQGLPESLFASDTLRGHSAALPPRGQQHWTATTAMEQAGVERQRQPVAWHSGEPLRQLSEEPLGEMQAPRGQEHRQQQGPASLLPPSAAADSPLARKLGCTALAGPVLGMQLRLPQPALLATATPDGRYAAVLLGSYARYEPTEVVVLRLGSASGTCAAPAGQPGACTAAEVAGTGGPSVVASVTVRQNSENLGWPLNCNSFQLAQDSRGSPILILSASLLPEDLPTHSSMPVSIISFTTGTPQLVVEIEPLNNEPAWTLLWLGNRKLLTAGMGGWVQPCELDLRLARYTWGAKLQVAVYHRFELTDLCQLAVAPHRPTQLTGLSSDGMMAIWDLSSNALLAVHSSHSYRIQQAHQVSWAQQLATAGTACRPGRLPPVKAAAADGGMHAYVAQLQPRFSSSEGEGGGGVLGAMMATGNRLTVGGTLCIEGLTAAAVCGRMCLAGDTKGLIHVWDLASGGRRVVDALGGQHVTCIANLCSRELLSAGAPSPASSGGHRAGQEASCGSTAAAGACGAPEGSESGGRQLALVTADGGNSLILDLRALLQEVQGS